MDFIHSVREENLACWWWTCSSSEQDAGTVTKSPLRETITCWGIRGREKHHCSYRPHCGNSVDQENVTRKIKQIFWRNWSELGWAFPHAHSFCSCLHSVQTAVDENRAKFEIDCPNLEWAQGIAQQQNGVNEDAWCEPCSEQEVACLECLEERRQPQEAENAQEQFGRCGDKEGWL